MAIFPPLQHSISPIGISSMLSRIPTLTQYTRPQSENYLLLLIIEECESPFFLVVLFFVFVPAGRWRTRHLDAAAGPIIISSHQHNSKAIDSNCLYTARSSLAISSNSCSRKHIYYFINPIRASQLAIHQNGCGGFPIHSICPQSMAVCVWRRRRCGNGCAWCIITVYNIRSTSIYSDSECSATPNRR